MRGRRLTCLVKLGETSRPDQNKDFTSEQIYGGSR